MSGVTRGDLPQVDSDSRAWWEACGEGRLLARRCGSCARLHHYPRPFCPHCWGEDLTWEEMSGRGRLYTWSVVFRNPQHPFADRVPYIPAIVDLEEGVRLMTDIVGTTPDQLHIDLPVQVTFEPLADGMAAPMFTPL